MREDEGEMTLGKNTRLIPPPDPFALLLKHLREECATAALHSANDREEQAKDAGEHCAQHHVHARHGKTG